MDAGLRRLTDEFTPRLTRYPLGYRIRGWWLSRQFNQSGWLACAPGSPRPRVRNLGGWIEAGNCLFSPGVRLEVGPRARLSIGTGTFVNRNVEIIAWQDVSIGQYCLIGWDVIVMDTDQHATPGRGLVNRPVRIGDRVWIGARALILKGVTIGDGAVIGAGAIVTRDVPHGAVVTGPSAQVISR